MSRDRLYVRCRHCGLAHSLADSVCEVTGNRISQQRGIARQGGTQTNNGPLPKSSKRAATDEYIGRILGGRYRPVRLVGEGGSSSVYDCEDMKNGERVAMKVPHRSYITRRVSLKRFYQEASVIREIDHPNVGAILDIGQLENGTPYIVMELLKGETLEQRLSRMGPMDYAETCLLGMQILEALSFTHRIGVIHQDIKPGNIFLCKGGVLKLLDFGLSKKLFTEARSTPQRDVVGTPLYIAPEQLTGRHLDLRVDIYAVGVVLQECLFGYPPFHSTTVADLLDEIQNQGPISIYEGRPGTPPPLASAIEKAVHRRPSRRYESAIDMYAVLEMLYRALGGNREDGIDNLMRTLPAPPIRGIRNTSSDDDLMGGMSTRTPPSR